MRFTRMPMLLVVALATLLISAGSAVAQTGGVVITSIPSGAIVELDGEHVLRGVTPWRLDRGLSGPFRIRAYKLGYQDWEGLVMLSSTRRDSVAVRLVRKTRLGAGWRSAVLPGWGQFHTEQNVKGAAFVAAEVAAIGAVFWADAKRDNAEEIYEDARALYLEADEADEIELRYAEMLDAFDEYEDKHLLRRRLMYIAGIIYLANIADAVFLFPEPGAGYFADASLSTRPGIYASVEPDAVRLGINVPF
ncbi:PEGA domain-containing protein [bacterium]|nr:PEGA domain-containing protein [bacterium]